MQEKFKILKLIQELLPFLWEKQEKIRNLFLLSFGLIFVSIGLDLSIPIILKEVVSKLSVTDKSMTYQLVLLLVAYGIIWMLSQTIENVRQIIMARPLERCIRLFCSKLFDHLHSLPMKFHLDRKTGAITNALERAQHGFPDVFWGLFLFIIPTIIELFLAAMILCYYYGAIYGFILLFMAIIFITFTFYATERASHLQTLSNEQQLSTNANIAITCPSSETSRLLEKIKNLKFQNVSFGYEPSRLVLKDVNLCLENGHSLGIVGVTGSGKSTISNLLYKFYDVKSGKILINNENIQTLKMESLYKLFGIVPQDITLFNTTIYENILFACPSAHKEEVEKVIELAQLGSVLKKLPSHYETIVGERGLKLSGGEKQRIALARVLFKRPALYIFDEATSSLDLSTEETIMKNMAPILKTSTSLIMAHRLSTVVNADGILVFHQGSIEERGTHSSLLKQQGLYASLWKTHEESHRRSYAA